MPSSVPLPWHRIAVAVVAIVLTGLTAGPRPSAAQALRMADLGTCPLESGAVIQDCVLGYRTVGELNSDGSNAVLLPSWGGGTSEQKLTEEYVGPDGWVDPDRHFIIVVDAFGNGVSSSPSNSPSQPGDAFPRFTIRDLVRAQYRLVTEVLGLEGLHGVAGLSLGGMQAFEWAVTYPDFVDRVVPVVGTPKRSAYDLLSSTLFRWIFESCDRGCSERAREAARLYFTMMLRTPEHWNRTLDRADVPEFLEEIREGARDLPATEDILTQIRAAEAFDVTERFGGSLERAADAVEADILVVVATHDQLTTPEPSRRFVELADGRLHESDSDCGHHAFLAACDAAGITPAIRAFLR
jgi:homoserine O-acetyltransferase/O-succinyltransferase